MIRRIHIFGASGSGTTTLARALADTLGIKHLDTDDYFWIPTDPPFRTIRDRAERQDLLRQALDRDSSWVLSGSLCGWGDFAIPLFDLIVFLWVPGEIRLKRLRKREIERYGPGIETPGNPRYQSYMEFLAWARAYDTGGADMRSRSTHESWIAALPCQVIRIEGDGPIQGNLKTLLRQLSPANGPEGNRGSQA